MFVVAVVVFSGKHHKVTNLINVFWCTVFIGMVYLMDFGSKEVVLSLLDIKFNTGDDFVGGGLFNGNVCTEQD